MVKFGRAFHVTMVSYEQYIVSTTEHVIHLLDTKYQTLGHLLENEPVCRHEAVAVLDWLGSSEDLDDMGAAQLSELLQQSLSVYQCTSSVLA